MSSTHLSSLSARKTYELASASAFLHPNYLDRFSKAVQLFLTHSQAIPTVNYVVESIKTSWEHFMATKESEEGASPPKKRKRQETATNNSDTLAVTFSIIVRFASVVLSSLPTQSLPQSSRQELRTLIENFQRLTLRHALSKSLKMIKKSEPSDWALGVATTSWLRLHYILNLPQHQLAFQPYYSDKLSKILLEIVQKQLLPELAVEIVRKLYHDLASDLLIVHSSAHFLITLVQDNPQISNLSWTEFWSI